MHQKSWAHKHYNSARYRFLKPVIEDFFATTLSHYFPPILQEKLVDELIGLLEECNPESKTLKPGQILWVALYKNTRAGSPGQKFMPVILTIIFQEDVKELSQGKPISKIVDKVIARIMKEAYRQGGILSSRDVSLLTLRSYSSITKKRIRYEKEHDCILPHTGALHDMGSTVTHKKQIVRKIVMEKKDPSEVARECNHSQKAVDYYLKNFNRVKTAYKHKKDIQFVSSVTGIAKNVVKEYLELI